MNNISKNNISENNNSKSNNSLDYNMDDLLKTALAPKDVPPQWLNDQVLRKSKERKNMKRKRRIPAAVIAFGVLLLSSATALAAYHYLSPAQVAAELNNDALYKAFLSDEAVLVNETQEIGGYRITLLGSAAGKNISDSFVYENGIPKDDRIYTVVAIEHVDGTPMPAISSWDYGEEPFYMSYYIHGLDPAVYSIRSMGGGYTEFVRDGTEYRIIETDNIQMFADQGIYIGVNSGQTYDDNAYIYDVKTGEISRNTKYEGVNALFHLPIDVSKADPEATEAYLEELRRVWHTPSEPIEMNEADLSVEDFMKKFTPENIDEYAAPIESTRMVCPIYGEGLISYEYELESGAGGSGTQDVSTLFPEQIAGAINIGGYGYSEGLEDLRINVFILNDDNTVTFVVYQPLL